MTYYTANDITPNRCTITGSYSSRSKAEAAVESNDELGVFESDESIAEGARAYHLNGACWAAKNITPLAKAQSASSKITSVSGKNHDGTGWTLSIGDRVDIAADESDEDSADRGVILSFPSRGKAVVHCDGYDCIVNVDSLSAV